MSETFRHSPDIPPVWLLAVVGLMFALHTWMPLADVVPAEWRTLGYVPMLLVLPVAIASITRFRRAGTAIKPFGEVRSLVLGWPYTWTRNPMYVGLVAIAFGIAIRLGTLSPLVGPPLLWLALDRRFVRREERFLRVHLGTAYDEYCRRVRRWI